MKPLYLADLFRMYTRFVIQWLAGRGYSPQPSRWRCRWQKCHGLQRNHCQISGGTPTPSGTSLVHRVQRAADRITGASTLCINRAIMTVPDEVELNIDQKDLLDVYRASGLADNRSIQLTQPSTYLYPNRACGSVSDEKSQHKNKAKAMKVLSADCLKNAS